MTRTLRVATLPISDALALHAEDLVEIDAAEGDEGRRGIRGRASKLRVERREEARAQVAIGGGDGALPPTRSWLTRRSCKVRLTRSLRPRVCGE